jgi:hypothetical protein
MKMKTKGRILKDKYKKNSSVNMKNVHKECEISWVYRRKMRERISF